jgi:DNA-binding transcriptional MerR regulator
MAIRTIQDVARHCGLSEPTLRYYEEIGLIGPIDRDERSGHRRYGNDDVETIEVLTCLRAVSMGIEEMRAYLANRNRGPAAAAEQRDLLLRHAERIEAEIAAQQTRLSYLRVKAQLWDARARDDADAEAEVSQRLAEVITALLAPPVSAVPAGISALAKEQA